MTENELIIKYQTEGDLEARNKVIMSHYGRIVVMARRLRHTAEIVSDLIQEGMLGLIKAIEKFDTTKGLKFVTFLSVVCKRYMMDYLLDTHGAMRFASRKGTYRRIYFQILAMENPYEATYLQVKDYAKRLKVPEKDLTDYLSLQAAEYGAYRERTTSYYGENPEEIAIKEDIIKKVDENLRCLPYLIEKGLRCKFQETRNTANPELAKTVKESGYSRQNFTLIMNKNIKKISQTLFGGYYD